jgi:hypothetical protein
MFEGLVFHNGALKLPTKTTPNGQAICDGTPQETQAAAQRLLIDRIRQGGLAERLGQRQGRVGLEPLAVALPARDQGDL